MAFVQFVQASCTVATKALYFLYKGSVLFVQVCCTILVLAFWEFNGAVENFFYFPFLLQK